ncbi:MAG: flagellar motor switch protein FliN [Desulfobacteraceae bacterium]|uniref:Flagellar motor switch protein FliN n=1 Tax=Candidatus Desulfatibia vada TaxID=2841696 RepID=A0A8J6TS64_9BACT|nr:flagellar motor switch protein FliN [Candidatus Desulfatibia vada]MBL6971236.1 flagellar motor switch protein FliN [Desulfobacterales bacterium]NQT70765.1 flagellar motor switch protein FliN [Desulfobacteraceae bacterium]
MSQTKEGDQTDINGAGQEGQYGLDLILDIDLNVSVELGKVKMPVKDLLQLGQGSIVELAKSVGEPLDIYVNNTLIAKGEVVILDEKFGIRVSDIINPIERIKSLT